MASRGTPTAGTTRSSRPGPKAAASTAIISAAASAGSPISSGASAATGIPEEARAGLDAFAAGIRSYRRDNLFTGPVRPEISPLEFLRRAPTGSISTSTYTYGIVHRSCIEDWQRDPVWPFFLIESTYEGEHNASDLQIRRQACWSVLCGGNGHLHGQSPDLALRDGWQDALDLPGSVAMARWGDFFRTSRGATSSRISSAGS